MGTLALTLFQVLPVRLSPFEDYLSLFQDSVKIETHFTDVPILQLWRRLDRKFANFASVSQSV